MDNSGQDDRIHSVDSLDYAFYKTVHAYKGGAPALAKAIGMKSGVLQNKADPNMDHEPTLKQARSVMLVSGDFQVLDVLNRDCGFVNVPIQHYNETGDVGLLQQMLLLDAAHGAFAQELHDALDKGKLTKDELDKLRVRNLVMLKAQEGMLARLDACKDD